MIIQVGYTEKDMKEKEYGQIKQIQKLIYFMAFINITILFATQDAVTSVFAIAGYWICLSFGFRIKREYLQPKNK